MSTARLKGSAFIELWETLTIAEREAIEARLWPAVRKQEDGCWIWTKCIAGSGYGYMRVRHTSVGTHRLSWVLSGQNLIAGMELDHLCRVRACCNPDHLELVTPAVNFQRGDAPAAQNLRKRFCKRGHEFTPENTRMQAGGRRRVCKACERLRTYDPVLGRYAPIGKATS